MQQVLGNPGIEFDARRFEYLGVPLQDTSTMGIASSTGITSAERWIASKQIVKFGGVGAGGATDDVTKVAIATIGLPIQLVSGYKGSADVRLAFNSGEVQGTLGVVQVDLEPRATIGRRQNSPATSRATTS